MTHTQAPQAHQERTWDLAVTNFRVLLEGALEGTYVVNGGQLRASLAGILGVNYVECYESLGLEARNRWVLQLIVVTCLAMERLTVLEDCLSAGAPPVTPRHFAALSEESFSRLVDEHWQRFQRVVAADRADWLRRELQEEHMHLRDRTDAKSSAVDKPFNELWNPYKEKGPYLFKLACGLATAYPNNSEIERLFAVYKYLFSERRHSTTVFSIAGSLMCNQIDTLRRLQPPKESDFGHTEEETSDGELHGIAYVSA
eukprot:GHVU01226122.1.p1 GENE.GHVU01226122.1~~GHVU01226122.1.p1  ORF type:complete len:257 (-),score=36.81 GHVU01226122.1:680-1450(-)